MTNLAALGSAYSAGLASRVGWHVVVQHEAIGIFALQCIDGLFVAARAQGSNHHRLGLSAGKQCRAMRARQYTGTDADRADSSGIAAINTRLAIQNLAADNLGLTIKEGSFEDRKSTRLNSSN